jgi:hypothetical protein
MGSEKHEAMMTVFAEAVLLGRAASEVFSFFTDEDSVGKVLGWRSTCPGSGRLTFDGRVTGTVPNRWIAFEGTALKGRAGVSGYLDITPVTNGTRVLWVSNVTMAPWAESLLAPFLHAISSRRRRDLQVVKRILESRPVEAPKPPPPVAAAPPPTPSEPRKHYKLHSGVFSTLGKRIRSIIFSCRDKCSHQQLFFVFDDGSYFEFYGHGMLTCCKDLDRGNEETVRNYIRGTEFLQEFVERRSPGRPPELPVQ